MIEETVTDMYRINDENRFLEVTYQGGDKECCTSRTSRAAHDQNIVRRAKKLAVKRAIAEKAAAYAPRTSPNRSDRVPRERGPPNTTNPTTGHACRARRASGSSLSAPS